MKAVDIMKHEVRSCRAGCYSNSRSQSTTFTATTSAATPAPAPCHDSRSACRWAECEGFDPRIAVTAEAARQPSSAAGLFLHGA